MRDFWFFLKIKNYTNMSACERRKRGIKRTVRLLGNFPGLWQRTVEQTPRGQCQWGGTLFVASGEADYYVILNKLDAVGVLEAKNLGLRGKSNQVIALHMEPDAYVEKLNYVSGVEHELASVFYTTSDMLLASGGRYVRSPPYVHFHCGLSYDRLAAMRCPVKKSKKIVVITSDLRSLKGHERRLDFISELDRSDLDCEIWGRGEGLAKFRKYKGFAASKWGVYKDAEFAIVVENSISRDYWSEKIADALLSYVHPLYYGCPNVCNYLPRDSFHGIDIMAPDSVQSIAQYVKNTRFESVLPGIEQGRKLILDRENLYAFLDRTLSAGGGK